MNILKKALSLLLVGIMAFSFAACHEKGEIAVTVKDGEKAEEFTSALYLYALMTAEGEAYNTAVEQLKEAGKKEEEITQKQVYAQKIDKKSYTSWTRDRAKEIVVDYAAYKLKCDENDLKIDNDTLNSIKANAQMYWSTYGYQAIYETNGVSYETFLKAMTYPYYANVYFESIYGEDGEKAVSKDEILKAMDENFAIANVIEVDLSEKKDDEVTKIKAKFDDYVAKLKKGTEFSEIYNDYYGIKDEETTSSNTSSNAGSSSEKASSEKTSSDATSSKEEEKALEPKDPYASLIGSEETDYESDHFKTVKEMDFGEIKLIDDTKNKTLTLLIRGDMMNDEYWTTNLNTVVLTLLKGDEFEKAMDEYIKGLEVKVDSSATKRFDVKDLYKYSEN